MPNTGEDVEPEVLLIDQNDARVIQCLFGKRDHPRWKAIVDATAGFTLGTLDLWG